MRISSGGPIQPQPQIQKAQPQQKQAEAAPVRQQEATPETAADENKTQTFDDTPLGDVSALGFDGETTAADASEEIAELFDGEEVDEADEAGEIDDVDDPDDIDEPDDLDDLEELERPEIEAAEDEDDEEEEGDEDYADDEGGFEGGEAHPHIDVHSLLKLVPEIRQSERFRIPETWGLFNG